MRPVAALLPLALALSACAEDPETTPSQEGPAPDMAPAEPDMAAPEPCPANFAYDPMGQPGVLTSFPDDYWTRTDARSGTGLKVQIPADTPWLAEASSTLQGLYDGMTDLDGFGTSAPVFVALDGTFPDLREMHPGVRLYDLGAEPPVALDYEPVVLDEGRTLALWPARPLRGATEHAVVITAELEAQEGCIDPSPVLAALLAGEGDGRLGDLAPRYAALAEQLDLDADGIRGAAVFTTQTLHAESRAIAADIDGRDFGWVEPPDCQPSGRQIRCEGRFEAGDYRGPDGVVADGTPQRTYQIPVSVWFPAEGEGPWPTYLVGHGLGGDRSLGGFVSQLTGDSPITVVAVDAVAHGQHPGGVGADAIELISRFFAADLASRTVDGLVLRDNFRQSTYDRLQTLALIRANPDIDGDGTPEVDAGQMGYFGFSLGGIMGSELLALDAGLQVAILGMPGGRLSSVMRDGAAFEALLRLFVPSRTPDGQRERLFGALQTVAEAGDPVNYGPHVLADRFDDGDGPHTLMVMAVGDQVVPNSTTAALARAWQIPPVRPTIVGLPFLPEPQDAPVQTNLGDLTAGLFQYKTVSEQDISGVVRRQDATHENVMLGRETILQVRRFHRDWVGGEAPVIVNPADEL